MSKTFPKMKICSQPFETMLILNPKVGTMPRKFECTMPKNENLLPAVWDHADSKSESWHHAKKIREVFSLNKSTRKNSSAAKNRVSFGPRLKTKVHFKRKQWGPRKILKIMLKNRIFSKFLTKILKQANCTLATEFNKA